MRRPTRTRALPALALAAVLSAAGCTSDGSSDEADPTPAGSTPSEPAGTTPPATTASSAPTSEPADTSAAASSTAPTTGSTPQAPGASAQPSASPPPADSSAARARRSLIPKSALPGLNAEWVWDQATTSRGPGHRPPGVCLQSSLTAIGGFAEARRDYTSSLSDQADAAVVSVVFPDVQTARTSISVLSAWQQRCQEHATQLGLKKVRVSSTDSVPTRVGTGTHWLVSYRPGPDRDSQWFDAEGWVVDGDTMTFVVIRAAGQDYNYEAGQSPIERALKVAGQRLHRTR